MLFLTPNYKTKYLYFPPCTKSIVEPQEQKRTLWTKLRQSDKSNIEAFIFPAQCTRVNPRIKTKGLR